MQTKKLDLLFHLALILLIGTIIIKPIYHRASITPTGTTYTFAHRILEDYYYYLMVIRQGGDAFLEYDQFTTEPTNPTAMHLYYLFLGKVGKIINLNSIALYYIGMIGGLILIYIFSWKLAGLLLPNIYKYVAMIIFFTASPFPDSKINFFSQSLAIGTSWWTNMDPYSRLTQVPHHFVGQGFMLAATYFTLLFILKKDFKWSVAAAVAVVLGILFYSIPIVTFIFAGGLTLTFFQFRPTVRAIATRSLFSFAKKNEKMLIGFGLILGVAIITTLFVRSILSNPGWPWSTFITWEANWYNHKIEIYPYTFPVYLLSFGILPLFVIPGIMNLVKKLNVGWMLIFFIFLTPLALYLGAAKHLYLIPKIRFVHSAPYIFGGLIATLGIQTIVDRVRKKKYRNFVLASIIILFMINAFTGFKNYWLPQLEKNDVFYNVYIPKEYFRIIEYLNTNSRPFSNVFASYAIGVYLPAFTKNNVFAGHMVSTANFWTKYSQANSFFSHEMKEEDALTIFKTSSISYVLGEEPGLGITYKNILKPLYSVNNLTLYTPIYEER